MIINLYVTRDLKLGEAVSGIQMFKNNEVAKRNFINAIANIIEQGNPEKCPIADLDFVKIGSFDNETLVITPEVEVIINGATCIAMSKKEN